MPESLERGREAYGRRAWVDAYDSLSLADREDALGAEDLELLATSAYMIGRDSDHHRYLERAHHAHLDAEEGDEARAARCAFWLGLTLLFRGDKGQASGWLARARRLVEGRDCVEHGYLLLPVVEQRLGEGRGQAAHAAATDAVEIGERFRDEDLIACARHLQGRALIRQGQARSGLALLDEAMVAATGGELSPVVTGLIYCSVIEACQQVFAWRRAREWTSALARWCERQPEMVAFTRTCLVHRAEIMQFDGAWPDAMEEACRACEGPSESSPGGSPSESSSGGAASGASEASVYRGPLAAATYRRGEIHRLRGEFAAAEEAYRKASRLGRDPQPGLALLRMSQGQADAAATGIRRVLTAATDRLQRVTLLPAHIEIMLATGDVQEARDACGELEAVAEEIDTDGLEAMAAHARGAVELAGGDAERALPPLRRAFEAWQRIEAPYEAARVRVLIGEACRSLGDEEAAELELDAAREVFEQLGAGPDLARLDSPGKDATSADRHGLTDRELQVLRLVAAGKINRAIAQELSVSERTVDRHVSNILTKLDVPSRTAATAYAYEHDLL